MKYIYLSVDKLFHHHVCRVTGTAYPSGAPKVSHIFLLDGRVDQYLVYE